MQASPFHIYEIKSQSFWNPQNGSFGKNGKKSKQN